MSIEMKIALVSGGLVLFILGFVVFLVIRRIPKRLKKDSFTDDWNELQLYCRDKKTWILAISEADELLDKALKKRKFKGSSMGERLVNAQRVFTNNDGVWFAHNLVKKSATKTNPRLKESEVKSALIAFRQALKDIGALPNGETRDS
jgi:uncharacterized protein YneF (UPF0154 family)